MRKVYAVLAWLVAVGVVAQAASIAFAHVGQDDYIDHGGTVDSALVEASKAGKVSIVGDAGFMVHAMNGMMVLPLLALLLLISSLFVRGRAPKLWALLVVGLVALQILLAFTMFGLPYLGILHGVNAIAILAAAVLAALRGARRILPTTRDTAATTGSERQDAVQA